MRAVPVLSLLLGLIGLHGTDDALAATLKVAVAGNFLPALERLAPDFEASSGHALSLSSGSTGKLYAQITLGAPFDLFLAADGERPRLLDDAGKTVPDTRFTYAVGRLVLWSPSAANADGLLARLHEPPPPRLALANPRLAPYGAAAEAWLRRRELWEPLAPTMVRGESVAQAFHFVASGNAEFGLVALAQLRLLPEDPPGAWWVVPADEHPPLEQQAVLLRDTPAGREFFAWLASPAVRMKLQSFGYHAP